VAGQVQDLEPPVADVDEVALVDDAGRSDGMDAVVRDVEALARDRGEQRLGAS
jgi:hypothetical protein